MAQIEELEARGALLDGENLPDRVFSSRCLEAGEAECRT